MLMRSSSVSSSTSSLTWVWIWKPSQPAKGRLRSMISQSVTPNEYTCRGLGAGVGIHGRLCGWWVKVVGGQHCDPGNIPALLRSTHVCFECALLIHGCRLAVVSVRGAGVEQLRRCIRGGADDA